MAKWVVEHIGRSTIQREVEEEAGPVAWRWETTSEHIARDMAEGRFPKQSERQRVPDPAPPPCQGGQP